MPVAQPGVCPGAVRAQQGATTVAAHHNQEAGHVGSAKPGSRRELSSFYFECFSFFVFVPHKRDQLLVPLPSLIAVYITYISR